MLGRVLVVVLSLVTPSVVAGYDERYGHTRNTSAAVAGMAVRQEPTPQASDSILSRGILWHPHRALFHVEGSFAIMLICVGPNYRQYTGHRHY